LRAAKTVHDLLNFKKRSKLRAVANGKSVWNYFSDAQFGSLFASRFSLFAFLFLLLAFEATKERRADKKEK